MITETVSLGQLFKELRESKNLTLSELAREIKLSYSFICRLETGTRQPSFKTLDILAKFYEVNFVVIPIKVGAPIPSAYLGEDQLSRFDFNDLLDIKQTPNSNGGVISETQEIGKVTIEHIKMDKAKTIEDREYKVEE